jgi:hypothetical protein
METAYFVDQVAYWILREAAEDAAAASGGTS